MHDFYVHTSKSLATFLIEGIPFLIGKETEEPKILLFICDVISSGPSIVWVKYFSSSETILLKWFSKSTRTEGSAFSFIVRLAEVCL